MSENLAWWFIQGPGWLLFLYLAYSQCPAAFSYALGVRMGSQEPAEQITEVGVAFFWGFAVADLLFYVPALGVGLLGHLMGWGWAEVVLAATLGITVYWPIVCLAAAKRARGAPNWSLPNERQFWIALPPVVAWAAASLLLLAVGVA